MNRSLRLSAIAAVLVLAACKPHPGQPQATASKPAPVQSAASTPSPSAGLADVGAQPKLHLPTVDGKIFDLAEQRGHWVVVNDWATWCGPCLEEMPDLSALAALREYIKVVGVANDDIAPAELRAFLQKHPVVYPIVQVDPAAPPADFGMPPTLPVSWLIDPQGKVVKRFMRPVKAADIEAAIAAAGGPAAGT
ncbi:MAG: TlpA family protein disulfide reductase [Xanthomonadales bacterium]|nr:TlpA family protein disulfide reductase [Xanthomonadales bacterium]